ncbi:hypothetical protein BG003_002913 [Podila horticola]|nr:hypothetical protein BG003_002913 [Podila horticola]
MVSTSLILAVGCPWISNRKLHTVCRVLFSLMLASKELVAFAFTSSAGNDNSYSNMNLNVLPLAPVFGTYPNGVTMWSTAINNNGTAILETRIVGYQTMFAASDNAGYNCEEAQRLFLPTDPKLCYNNRGMYSPVISSGGGAFYKWNGNVQIGGGIMTGYMTND